MELTLDQEGQISHFSTERKLQCSVWLQSKRCGSFGLAFDFAGRFNFFMTGFEFISLGNMRATPNRFNTRHPKQHAFMYQETSATGLCFWPWLCNLVSLSLDLNLPKNLLWSFFDLYGYVWTSNVWTEMPLDSWDWRNNNYEMIVNLCSDMSLKWVWIMIPKNLKWIWSLKWVWTKWIPLYKMNLEWICCESGNTCFW